jgi:branched-chain amino acid transport system permease protein
MSNSASAAVRLLATSRWRAWEIVVWLIIAATPFALASHASLINEIAILALFALSLDLILGVAGLLLSARRRSSAPVPTRRRCSPST